DFGDLFSRLMLWLLGRRGLVLVEPRSLRELMVPLFARLIEEPEATGRLINEAGERLREEGQAPPLRQPERFCNFFIDRRRAIWRDGRFSVDGRTYAKEELLELLQEEPHRFSSDVVTRPLIQDYLFPTYAYIAGPHEAAYLAQLEGVYHWFSLEPPRIVPRHRATLVERRIRKILDRYAPWADGLEDYRQPERLMRQIVSASTDLGPTFARCREEVDRILREVQGYASQIDPELRRPCAAARAKIAKVLDQLEAKVAKAKREREPLLKEQIYRAANHLFPLGQPQERVLNIVEFLIRHSPMLLEWVEERFAGAEPGEHLVIDLPVGRA
ncbi:MAG: bacillithiol biosynthesis BshC, partial [Candidatus Bipolaricaulia bacterium]